MVRQSAKRLTHGDEPTTLTWADFQSRAIKRLIAVVSKLKTALKPMVISQLMSTVT